MKDLFVRSTLTILLASAALATPAIAQTPRPQPAPAAAAPPPAPPAQGVTLPPDYVIGVEDVLTVSFWGEAEMSADVVVRPDGKISLPLINELDAAALTPEALRLIITERGKRFVADPNVSVVVREIHSRKAFITGAVTNPGSYALGGNTTVLQLIALAGGLGEFANGKKIVIMRQEGGKSVALPFNYNEISKGRGLQQNIVLRPGDTVVVP